MHVGIGRNEHVHINIYIYSDSDILPMRIGHQNYEQPNPEPEALT